MKFSARYENGTPRVATELPKTTPPQLRLARRVIPDGGPFAFLEPPMPETLADHWERASALMDRLIYDARLLEGSMSGRPHDEKLHALEERAQAIARAIVAPIRGGKSPTAAPLDLKVRPGGCSAL